MQIIHTLSELKQVIAAYKRSAKVISLVPTMGNLHKGHLQLVTMAVAQSDIVVCSLFVNPLQFGENEDFEQYPRTLDADAEQLKKSHCDILFAPSVAEVYPDSGNHGRDQSQLVVPGISDILEGAARPGHFTGVATIVAKLFNMVQPDKAVFGAKDYQQLQVIKQFVREMCFPVEILSHPIVRQSNGLALSSRNGFLSNRQKEQASAIYKMLYNLAQQIKAGACNYTQLEQQAIQQLNLLGFETDYIEIRNTDLSKVTDSDKNADKNSNNCLVILVAAYLGGVRLLDNIQI